MQISAFETEVVYDLRSATLAPAARGSEDDADVIDLDSRRAMFGREPLFWSVWSTTRQQIARGEVPMDIIVGPCLLRPADTTAGAANSAA